MAQARCWNVVLRPLIKLALPSRAIDHLFRKIFPYEWLRGWKLPVMDDLLNSHPFRSYMEWLEANHALMGGMLPPDVLTKGETNMELAAGGWQGGAHVSKKATEPLVRMGLLQGKHMTEALDFAKYWSYLDTVASFHQVS